MQERPTVLLVDDDERLLETFSALLNASGFQVTCAATPQSAIRLLEGIAYDAVVTDVVFDGFEDGQQVLRASKSLQPKAVVVLITGYPEIEGAVTAMKGGAVDYLRKPVDPVVLSATIHRALRERLITSEAVAFGDLVDILSDMVANTIERVDPYTAGHGERTRRYSRMLAERLGMERAPRERLELAAIAHDYGKIYLDDLTFLTKKGPLTPDEYREVQRHPGLGARKLGGHAHLREVCQYVAEHHEKWDGSGYPKRLKGEAISMPGRVLGVVEVFDSLSTKRSYKEAWDMQRMVEFFGAQRGRAFDPDVLDEFLVLLEGHGEDWMAEPEQDRARIRAAGSKAGLQA